MNQIIASLSKLQDLDQALDDLSQARDGVAPQRERLKAEFQSVQSQFDGAKKSLTQIQVEKKNLELDIESKDQAVRKHSSELNAVKSNEAYKGLLTQIEEAKKAKSTLEDKVLELMERTDQLQKESKEADKRLQEVKSGFDSKIAALDAEEARLQAEIDEKAKDRDAYYQTLAPLMRRSYDDVRRGRRGVKVLAPIQHMTCGGCRMTLPASVVNEAMKGQDLVVCETCTRILYVPPSEEKAKAAPEPAPVPAPAAPASEASSPGSSPAQ